MYLQERKSELTSKLKDVKKQLGKEGGKVLQTKTGHNKTYYYDSSGKYLGPKITPQVQVLGLNRLNKQLQKQYEAEIKAIDICLKRLKRLKSAQQLAKQLHPAIQAVLNTVQPQVKTMDDDSYATKWQNALYRRKYIEKDLAIQTIRGDYVRSKTEELIADRLYVNGIPYRYEAEFEFEHETVHPDFTILNKRTRKEYIWEHCGMMDKDDYFDKFQYRLEEFAKMGYLVGKNLIVTFECSRRRISTQLIDENIKLFLQ